MNDSYMIVFVLAVISIIVIVDLIMCFFLCCVAGHWLSIYRPEQRCLYRFKEMLYSHVIPNFYGVFKSNYESML